MERFVHADRLLTTSIQHVTGIKYVLHEADLNLSQNMIIKSHEPQKARGTNKKRTAELDMKCFLVLVTRSSSISSSSKLYTNPWFFVFICVQAGLKDIFRGLSIFLSNDVDDFAKLRRYIIAYLLECHSVEALVNFSWGKLWIIFVACFGNDLKL